MSMPSKPMISLSSKDLPEIKKWKVGKEYEIELKVKQKGMRDEDGVMRAEFEIVEAKVCEE